MSSAIARSVFAGLFLLGLSAAPVAAASGAPQVSLGQFGPIYDRILPLLTLLFAGLALTMIVTRTWHAISAMGAQSGGGAYGGRGGASASDLIGSIVMIVLLATVAIYLAWNWVTVINAALDFLYSLTTYTVTTNA